MPEDTVERLFDELAGTQLPVPARATVAARGRQRRRRARGRALLAVAGAAVVAVGIGQLAALPRKQLPAADHHGSPSRVCVAAPTIALNLELRRALPISSQLGVVPLAVSDNGTALFAEVTNRAFHGIAEESLHTGAILTRIKSLPANYEGVQGGLAPGGELVWTSTYNTHGGEAIDYTPMWTWSPQTGRTVPLEPAGQHGDAMGAPVFLNQALAAWEQTDGSKQEIVEADLATGITDVIARGYLGPPVFVGTTLVWPVAGHANGPASHLVATNAAVFPARQHVAVPLPLRAAGHATLMGSSSQGSWATPVGLIASSGPATAYMTPDLTHLYYSPSPTQPARMVLALKGGNAFAPGLAIGDGYLGWTVNGDGSYVASTTTLAAARITDFGAVDGVGSDFVFVVGPRARKLVPRSPLYLFSGSTINALKCATPAKTGG